MTIKEPISSSEPKYSSPYSTSYSEQVEYPTSSYATSTPVPEPSFAPAPATIHTSSINPSAGPTNVDGLFNPATVNPLVSDENHFMKGRWEMVHTEHNKGFFTFTRAELVSTQIGQSYFENKWEMSGKCCWCFPWSDKSIVKTIPRSDTTYEAYFFGGFWGSPDPDPQPLSGSISDGPAGKIYEVVAANGKHTISAATSGKSKIIFQGRDKFLLELTNAGDASTWSMEMMRRT